MRIVGSASYRVVLQGASNRLCCIYCSCDWWWWRGEGLETPQKTESRGKTHTNTPMLVGSLPIGQTTPRILLIPSDRERDQTLLTSNTWEVTTHHEYAWQRQRPIEPDCTLVQSLIRTLCELRERSGADRDPDGAGAAIEDTASSSCKTCLVGVASVPENSIRTSSSPSSVSDSYIGAKSRRLEISIKKESNSLLLISSSLFISALVSPTCCIIPAIGKRHSSHHAQPDDAQHAHEKDIQHNRYNSDYDSIHPINEQKRQPAQIKAFASRQGGERPRLLGHFVIKLLVTCWESEHPST